MAKYLSWQSNLSLEQVFSANLSYAYPTPYLEGVLFVDSLAHEKQRQVLSVLSTNGEFKTLTPAPFNLNTKINEYGGKPYWLNDHEVVFANQADQCLYRQQLEGTESTTPQAITTHQAGALQMYANVERIEENFYLAIVEQESKDSENCCFLAGIDCSLGAGTPQLVQQGADFYNNLVVDQVRKKVAWVEWNHPNMPWDSNQLWVADYSIKEGQLNFFNKRRINLASEASFCQLCFASNGKLFCVADRVGFDSEDVENFWNVYVLELDEKATTPKLVTKTTQEFGYPHWQFGDARLVQYGEKHLLAQATSADGDRLYTIDQDTLEYELFKQTNGRYQTLSNNALGQVALLELSADQTLKLLVIDDATTHCLAQDKQVIPQSHISVAQHLEFADETAIGDLGYGYYYPPTNSDYDAVGAPPLLVMVHGGPTARAYPNFDLQKQFWTNRGFAIFDVNHRGSSGHGRSYRDALLTRWGELDTLDIVNGVEHLIKQGMAHPDQICIRGKSAGGYAVLRALTEYAQLFRAGACYYGIGNLATLAEVTHKFEKYYTDRLIDEQYNKQTAHLNSSAYYQRSPINNIEKIRSAMIIFQGADDKVVPPVVAHEMVNALEKSQLAYRYIEYPGEGHGFRQIENNINAWQSELAFYREVLADG